MDERSFATYVAVMEWLEARKDDKEEHYYYGDIECMDGELVAPSEYEGININAEGRKAAAIIRKYKEGRK